jgi:hypothetical protein
MYVFVNQINIKNSIVDYNSNSEAKNGLASAVLNKNRRCEYAVIKI